MSLLISKNKAFSSTQVAAIFSIGLFSILMLFIFAFGFNLWFFILASIAGLIISIIWPAAGLTSIIVLTLIFAKQFTLQPTIIGQSVYKFYPIDVLLIGTYIGIFFRLLKKEIKWQLKTADILLVLFIIATFIYFLLSIGVWGGQFNLAFSSFKNYTFYPLLFYAFYLVFDYKYKFDNFKRFCFFAVLPIIGFFAYGLINGQGLWTEITPLSTEGSRFLDFDHAFYLSLAILAGLAVQFFSKKDNRVWFWLTPIYIFGVIGSMMRHLWIAGIIAGIYLFLVSYPNNSRSIKKLLTGYLLIFLSGVFTVFLIVNLFPKASFSEKIISEQNNIVQRAYSLSDSNDSSIAWRNFVWSSVWKEGSDRLFFGLGFGQKVFIEMPGYLDYVEVRNMHNSFLAILMQMGVIPFVILALFIGNIFINLKKVKDIAVKYYFKAAIIFCLIAFMFQPYLEANFFNIFFWAILGLSRRFYEGFANQQI